MRYVLFVGTLISLLVFPSVASAQPQQCMTAADKDCSGDVNLTEVVDYIGLWYSCSSCHPDLFQVIEAYYGIHAPPEAGFPTDYVSWWRFDGNADDEAGRNNGSFVGDATTLYDAGRDYGSGTNGHVLSLDGSSGYVNIGDVDNLKMGNNSFTLALWSYDQRPHAINSWGAMVQKSYPYLMWNDAYAGYGISRSGSIKNSVVFGISDGVSGRKTISSMGKEYWNFYVLVADRENNEMRGYVDGSRVGNVVNISGVGPIDTTNSFRIGYSGFKYHQGFIDDVMIFNRSLNATEIRNIYDSQRNQFCDDVAMCSDYTDSNDCLNNPCYIGNGCEWEGSCSETRKTWYVRPAGGSYGLEDGSSYDNAIDGLLNVKWGVGGVGAGDTLYVCGLHVYDMANVGLIASQADIHLSSGTSESSRIMIRGDCPSGQGIDQGIVWGSYRMTYDNWTDEGDNVWSIPIPASSYNDWVFQDIGNPTNEDFVLLDPEKSIEEVRNNPGSQYSVDYVTNSLLYVKLTDGGNPTGRIYANRWGYDWKIGGLQYITFLNLKFYNPYRFLWFESANHIRWEGCTLTYGEHSLISIFDDSDYMEVINCELSWAWDGIYTISGTNDAPNYYTFSGNYIHDISVRESTQNGDAHGIGIQGGHNGLIEKNYIVNAGNALLLHTFYNQELTNTTIRYNYIKDTNQLGAAGTVSGGYGITLMTDGRDISDRTGIEIYGNIVENASVGYRIAFSRDLIKLYNNLAINIRDDSFAFGGDSRVIDFDSGTAKFATNDVVTQDSGASATVKDISQQTGSSPNIEGTISLDDIVGSFVDNEALKVNGVTYAIADGTNYILRANIEMKNSISFNPNGTHISHLLSSGQGALISEYNLFWPDTGTMFDDFYGGVPVNFAGWQAKGWDIAGSAAADPLFIDALNGNFHLQSNSPAIDAGTDVGLTQDYEGNSIPQGLGWDIGAYEYSPLTCDFYSDCNILDNIPCIDFICHGAKICVPSDADTDGTPCTDDGLFCTGTETCQSRSCVSSGNPCALDEICDDVLSQCLPNPCYGIECSDYTDETNCANNPCSVGVGCEWNLGICEGIVPAGYVGYWGFEGNANDETGVNNGTFNWDATTIYDSERDYNADITNGYVLSLDGMGDYVDMGYDESLRMGSNSFTLCAWAYDKMPDGVNNWGPIAQKGGQYLMWNNDYGGYGISRYSSTKNRIIFGISDRSSGRKTIVADAGSDGWHFLVLKVDRENDEMKAYIDASQVGSTVDISGVGSISTSRRFRIGYSGYKYYNGTIDDVMIYNRALSETEIQQVYCWQGGAASFC